MAGTGLQTKIGDNTLYTDEEVTTIGPNYIEASGSSANALTADFTDINGEDITVTTGTRLLVKTDTTLQAGSNTIAINGGTATGIKNYNSANLNTATASGIILDMVYNGTYWIVLNSLAPTKWSV